jgi:hypothetical protein
MNRIGYALVTITIALLIVVICQKFDELYVFGFYLICEIFAAFEFLLVVVPAIVGQIRKSGVLARNAYISYALFGFFVLEIIACEYFPWHGSGC